MADNDFEFPPDQLADELTHPDANAASLFSSLGHQGQSYGSASPHIPLSVLAQMPVDQLPPTRPLNNERGSLAQILRGALTTSQMQSSAAAGAPMSASVFSATPMRAMAGVASLPTATLTYPHGGSAPHTASLNVEEEREATGERHPTESSGGGPEDDRAGAPPRMWGQPSRHARLDWSENEVRSFYRALSQYGTDFSAISVLFPNRSRNDIKRLYQREVRRNAVELQAALSRKEDIDMVAFNERFEAKKKEAGAHVKTKQLNREEEELVDAIASGPTVRTAGDHAAPGADLSELSEFDFHPAAEKSSPEVSDRSSSPTLKRSRVEDSLLPATVANDNETFVDLATRLEKEDNTALQDLYLNEWATTTESDFTFE